MSNPNTIFDSIIKANAGQPSVINFATTGHQQFLTASGAALPLQIPNPMVAIDTDNAFPGRSADGNPLVIRAAGTVVLGRGVVWQVDINQGTGLSPAIASTGSQTSPLGAGLYKDNWLIEVECMWDSGSTNLRGIQYGWAGGSLITQSAIILSSPANLAALQFNVAATVANLNVSNSISLTEFSAEYI